MPAGEERCYRRRASKENHLQIDHCRQPISQDPCYARLFSALNSSSETTLTARTTSNRNRLREQAASNPSGQQRASSCSGYIHSIVLAVILFSSPTPVFSQFVTLYCARTFNVTRCEFDRERNDRFSCSFVAFVVALHVVDALDNEHRTNLLHTQSRLSSSTK